MTIQPSSNLSISSVPAEKLSCATANPTATPAAPSETLQTPGLEALRSAIAAEPEIRPSEAARAIIWARDPDYPPLDVLNNIAGRFLAEAVGRL